MNRHERIDYLRNLILDIDLSDSLREGDLHRRRELVEELNRLEREEG